MPGFARTFNGTNIAQIQCASSSSLLNPSTFTMAGWINVSDPTFGGNDFMMGCIDTFNDTHHLLPVGDGTNHYVVRLLVGDTTLNQIVSFEGGLQFNVNTWAHIAGTFISGGAVAVFLNGTKDPASFGTATYASAAGPFFIGTDFTGDFSLTGSVADLAIWNTVLSTTQIANLAAGRRANTVGANANLVGYWPITGQSPEPDFSGNGNPGVLSATGVGLTGGPPLLDPLPVPTASLAMFDIEW